MIEECFAVVEPLLGTKTACAAVGRARASHYRRLKPCRTTERKPRPAPPNKLSDEEVDAVLEALRSERFADASPDQVYFTLLDEGTYLASVSSFYRILRAHSEVRERRRQATHPAKVKPELVADRPLVVWSWDITKLKGPKRGEYYDLYVVLDIFSRYVVAWCVAPSESGELAKDLIADAVRTPPGAAGPADHPRRSRQLDDVEPGGRAAQLLGHQALAQPPPREQRQPLLRGAVQDPQVLPGLPRALRLHRRRPGLLRGVLRVLQPRPPSLGHRATTRPPRCTSAPPQRCAPSGPRPSRPPTRRTRPGSTTANPSRRSSRPSPGSTSRSAREELTQKAS